MTRSVFCLLGFVFLFYAFQLKSLLHLADERQDHRQDQERKVLQAKAFKAAFQRFAETEQINERQDHKRQNQEMKALQKKTFEAAFQQFAEKEQARGQQQNLDRRPLKFEAVPHKESHDVEDEVEKRRREKAIIRSRALGKQRTGSGIFCYALTNNEPTVKLLAQQLRAGCDDWALFSSHEDSATNTFKAFTEEQMVLSMKGAMREMVVQGAYQWLHDHGVFDKYLWIVKLDPDSYVRSSTLKTNFARYPKDFTKLLGSANFVVDDAIWNAAINRPPAEDTSPISATEDVGGTEIDGYFNAIPSHLAQQIFQIASSGSHVCDSLASGHNSMELENICMTPQLCDSLNKDAANPKQGCTEPGSELPVGARRRFAEWIGKPWTPEHNSNRTLWALTVSRVDLEWDHEVRSLTKECLHAVMKEIKIGTCFEFSSKNPFGEDEQNEDTFPDNLRCMKRIGAEGVELFMDQAGDSLIALESLLDRGCNMDHFEVLEKHYSAHPGSRLCDAVCSVSAQRRRLICLSPHFSIVHAVKKSEHYQQLLKAFP